MRQLLALAVMFVLVPFVPEVARAADTTVPPGAIAVVDGRAIPTARLAELLTAARHAYGPRFPARGTQAYRRIQDDAVRFLVDWAEVRGEASALGAEVTDAQVSARVAAIRHAYFRDSDRLYRQELARQGLTAAQARANVRRQLLAAAIYAAVTRGAAGEAEAVATWNDWLDALHARYAPLVAYAPGFEPGA